MLDKIFDVQAEFQKRVDPRCFNPETVSDYIRDHRGYLEDELAEACYELPGYKLWKDYSKQTPEEVTKQMTKVRSELVDAFHFFVNICIAAGMSAEDLTNGYFAKHAENVARQDRGYTHDTSYRDGEEPTVMVKFGDEVASSTDFVTVLHNEDGEPVLFYNGDALTLGLALAMIEPEFNKMMYDADPEAREAIAAVIERFKGPMNGQD